MTHNFCTGCGSSSSTCFLHATPNAWAVGFCLFWAIIWFLLMDFCKISVYRVYASQDAQDNRVERRRMQKRLSVAMDSERRGTMGAPFFLPSSLTSNNRCRRCSSTPCPWQCAGRSCQTRAPGASAAGHAASPHRPAEPYGCPRQGAKGTSLCYRGIPPHPPLILSPYFSLQNLEIRCLSSSNPFLLFPKIFQETSQQ